MEPDTAQTLPAFHVMAKPVGSRCNLDCEYCFYLKKVSLYPDSNFRKSDELMEDCIRQTIDTAGKPVGVRQHTGRRPIAAFGNSDGDFEMLEWVTGVEGARLGVLLHHDDTEREFAYDRHTAAGRLDRAMDEAAGRGWAVVSMKNDWKTVYP
jgi:hypothetical protein